MEPLQTQVYEIHPGMFESHPSGHCRRGGWPVRYVCVTSADPTIVNGRTSAHPAKRSRVPRKPGHDLSKDNPNVLVPGNSSADLEASGEQEGSRPPIHASSNSEIDVERITDIERGDASYSKLPRMVPYGMCLDTYVSGFGLTFCHPQLRSLPCETFQRVARHLENAPVEIQMWKKRRTSVGV